MKKILLKDHTNGEMAFCWNFIQKLHEEKYSLTLESKNKYNFPEKWFSNSGTSDLTIIFKINNGKTEKKKNVYEYTILKTKKDILLPEMLSMFDTVEKFFHKQDLSHRRILISGGPTVEDIDPVRFLSNRSTGKMAIALCKAAFIRGAKVTLVSGPIHVDIPEYLNVTFIRSAEEMKNKILKFFAENEIFISAAAVADYTPIKKSINKIKKSPADFNLQLKRTTDILGELSKIKNSNQILAGFSVETENLEDNSVNKLKKKNLDIMVANNPNEEGSAFGHETNKVTIITKKGNVIPLPLKSKLETAHRILDYIIDYDRNR